ncbi:MAG TPA: hypothetical protein VD931_08400 [Baekduia sp.]|nr:hypothetical protein [Baekduia sp.]
MIRPLLRRAALSGLVATLALPVAAAEAKPNLFSVMMDDDQLVYRDDDTRDRALRRMKDLGVDQVRVTVLWSVVADGARKTKALDKRFRKLKADNPKAYPRLNWDRYDRLVRAARRLGIGIYFNVTGPGPEWGHAKAPRSQARNKKTWKPKPKEFYKFVQAVGKRFSGRYRDENDERVILPKVGVWSLWNEPNQGGWLTPQFVNGRPYSPHLYRELYDHGYRALVSTGHAGDVIMMGETAPLGSSNPSSRAPMRPAQFLREMFCVDGNLQPLQGAEAAARKCSFWDKKGKLNATWWAHHPYTKNKSPQARDANPDSITMANIGDLATLLDGIAANTARIRSGVDILSAEFGFETNPPDPFSGIDPKLQANWNALGELQAFLHPRVVGQTQFLLYDVPPRRQYRRGSKSYWFTYQSGLYTNRGVAKPAATQYAFPFLVFPTGTTEPSNGRPHLTAWGGLRFRQEGVADDVAVDWKPADGSTDWQPIGSTKTNQPIQLDPAQSPIQVFEGYFYIPAFTVPGPGKVRMRLSIPQAPFHYTSQEFDVQ